MTDTKIAFLYFDGCPLAPRARENLLDAIKSVRSAVPIDVVEVDLMAADAPEHLRRWGSPTILLNGQDITGGEQGGACSCRLYSSEGGVPTVADIIQAIAPESEHWVTAAET